MGHLIKSELIRFRRLGLGFALGHLLLLKAISGFDDLFAASSVKVAVGGLVYGLTGLIFGLYQMGSYRKAHRWAYLIHRPLAPAKIFLALAAAAGLWLVLVLSLPQLGITLYLDLLTSQWVDVRHYLLIPFLFGTAFSFYLAGCFIALSPSRAAFLVLLLPSFFLTRQAEGWWIFLPQVVVLAWLGYLALSALRPDLSAAEHRPLVLAMTSLPFQYALFWGVVAGSALVYQSGVIFQEEGWRGYAVHAWDDHFPEGTYHHAEYLHGAAALAHGLRGEDTERNKHLLQQIQLAEVLGFGPRYAKASRRGQPMFADGPSTLTDREEGVQWTFRHDRMLFQGRDALSGAPRGWLGLPESGATPGDDPRAFSEVPVVAEGGQLVTRRRIFEFDPLRKRIEPRFEAPEREKLVTAFERKASMLTAMTDQALYFFDPKALEEGPGLLNPTGRLSLPAQLEDLWRVHVAELLDGYLVSFIFGTRSEAGYGEAKQVVVEVGIDGEPQVVAQRSLLPGWPAAYRYRGFIFSPILQTGHDLAWSWIAPKAPGQIRFAELGSRPIPAPVWGWALLVALLSAAVTAALGPFRELGVAERRSWVVAGLLLGLPSLLSFLLLTRRKEVLEGAARRLTFLRWSWRTAR